MDTGIELKVPFKTMSGTQGALASLLEKFCKNDTFDNKSPSDVLFLFEEGLFSFPDYHNLLSLPRQVQFRY